MKPASILIAPRPNEHEFAKMVDFGLVKSTETNREAGDVTAVNTITGTPLYMSPEAIRDPEPLDGRSALYALGAVAWFLLVGRPVFEGGSIVEVCGKHLHEPPRRPSAVLGSSLPSDLEDVVLGCLDELRAARPADARAALRLRLCRRLDSAPRGRVFEHRARITKAPGARRRRHAYDRARGAEATLSLVLSNR